MCGELQQSMYGTRDAAQNWEKEYSDFMMGIGFERGESTPCIFYHKDKELRAVVHGDDFTILGWGSNLDWCKCKVQEKFDMKHRGRLGPQSNDDKSIRILNRVVEWGSEGISYEADQRHAEIIVSKLGLKGESRSVGNPGIKPSEFREEEGDDEELEQSRATLYRGLVARANYLTQDRSDIQFAVRELSRYMAKPTQGDLRKLKRLGRYLIGKTRAVTLNEISGKSRGDQRLGGL